MPLATERTLATIERVLYRLPRESAEMFSARVDHMLPDLRFIARERYPARRIRVVVDFTVDGKTATIHVSTLKNRDEL
jgi:hypothetical protein